MSSEQEDKLEGEYKSYYDNGQTKTHEFYRNGKLEGRYKSWYDSGGIIEHKFYEDGNLEGKRQIWKPNGELWVQLFYRRGSQEGEERSYWVYPTYDYYREGKSVDNSFSDHLKLLKSQLNDQYRVIENNDHQLPSPPYLKGIHGNSPHRKHSCDSCA